MPVALHHRIGHTESYCSCVELQQNGIEEKKIECGKPENDIHRTIELGWCDG